MRWAPTVGFLPLAVVVALVAVFLVGCGAATRSASPDFSVLVFSKTAEYRHPSIPDGVAAVQWLGRENVFAVEATESAALFTDEDLRRYDAVVFFNTTGDVLDAEQQAAFERYVRAGGGYAGVHAAADTEYDWEWYGGLVGAYFESHPRVQEAEVKVIDRTHPSTPGLLERWTRADEWYNFRTDPSDEVHVLAALDEGSYSPGEGAMGSEHPISWCHDYDGGRSWYTGAGHTPEGYREDLLLDHLLGGIEVAAGATEPACGAAGSRRSFPGNATTSNG